jgi:gas vesicle protein
MSSGNGGMRFLAGFFVGATLGSAVAVLLAPKTGRELRESLNDEAKRARERASGAASEIRTRGEKAAAKTRQTLSDTVERLKEAGYSLKSSGESHRS